ncbi:hypothetical protein RF11_07788 [Thelohanellus kitauei]|uniref:Uncharacterized protein n=1 Tax=Thelohanellus kitauei TaxID=669202 RepID=A0A0C2J9D3_THEKT|nr:hypothetical protein RF11_07788 [Thelohanellus kitauei]
MDDIQISLDHLFRNQRPYLGLIHEKRLKSKIIIDVDIFINSAVNKSYLNIKFKVPSKPAIPNATDVRCETRNLLSRLEMNKIDILELQELFLTTVMEVYRSVPVHYCIDITLTAIATFSTREIVTLGVATHLRTD